MMEKKIVILLNTSWYIYNTRKNLIKILIAEGFKIYTVAPYDSNYSEKLKALGCEHHDLPIDSKSKNPFSEIALIWRIRRKLKEIKPDVLLNFTIKPNVYGTIAASSLKIPCINNISGLGTLFSENPVSRTIFKILFKFSQNKAKTVFFQNPEDLQHLTGQRIVRKEIARLLPGSGVSLNEFSFSPAVTNGTTKFLLMARMIYPKGIDELVSASHILREKGYDHFKVLLLGELGVNNPLAISQKKMDEYCRNEYVNYLGKTDDVKTVIQKSDAVVLPSYYKEGTPRSLLEALSVGRPVITTNMPGCKDTVVDNSNGFICAPKSAKELAQKMELFLKMDQVARLKMGEQSRKIAEEKFDEKIVIDFYLDAIQSAI
ncbi:glycosyltransferase family 4 protein [Maribellus maritimus]|uniref:glycosyltransferase family 4 protein n=1 Tax=Maribellus maritimus TaxID=2870838 RepID=UPI001EEBE1AE|nr:glycosyltransferase family 4 protein [Maribellus maritimus]MCG6188438.1 glycosyltransferase family 4 protein [Maribellus maritimus]